MAQDFGFGFTFTLNDKFTKVADNIGKKWDQMTTKFKKETPSVVGAMDSLGTAMAGLGAAAGLLAPFGIAIQKSAALSDQLADVTKTTNITGQALQDLRIQLENLDTRTSLKGLLEIAKAGGSMGIAQKDIFKFTESIDKLNVALGDQFSSPEELARGVAQLSNSLKDIQTGNIDQDLMKVGNVLNFMGANAKATEKTIFNITKRLAGLQASAKLSSEQLFGIATAMAETGLSSEVIGSNVTLAIGKMLQNTDKFADAIGVTREQFKALANKDSLGAFDLFAKKIKEQNKTSTSFNEKLKAVGLTGARMSNVFIQYAQNIDNVKKRIDQAGKALTNTDSIMAEFNAKNQTLAAALEKGGKQVEKLITKIGDALAPLVGLFFKALSPIINFFVKIVETPVGKVLVQIAGGVTLVVASMIAWQSVTVALTPVLATFGATISAAFLPVTAIIAGVILLAIAVKKISSMFESADQKTRMLGFGLAMLLGPIGLVIAGVKFVTQGLRDFQKVAEGGEVGKGIILFMQKIGGIITGVKEIFGSVSDEGFTLSKNVNKALERLEILDTVIAIGTWIVRIRAFAISLFQTMRTEFQPFVDLWNELGNVFDALLEIGSDLFDSLGIDISKVTGELDLFKQAGKIVAHAILAPFKLVLLTIRGISKVVKATAGFLNSMSSNNIIGPQPATEGNVSAVATEETTADNIAKATSQVTNNQVNNSKATSTVKETNTINNPTQVTNVIQLDGVEIGESVMEFMEDKAAQQ